MTPRIALDGMGGDDAPISEVAGAIKAAERLGVEILLVGHPDLLRAEFKDGVVPENIRIVEAREVIGMHDSPTEAVRGKPDASMNIAARLVKNGEADAFVTTGNTGAAMAAALLTLGRVKGIARPALATIFPTGEDSREILLDIGANAECRPFHLVQFAHMGSAYMRLAYGLEQPRVALLSNGTEEGKGNGLVVETHALLRQSQLNFIGNVEGNDLNKAVADVVVMDGFTGNVLIKTAEATAELLGNEIRAVLTRNLLNKLAALFVMRDMRRVRRRIDHTEAGGAQLLGVNGVTVIGHGRSNALAVFAAIRAARDAVRNDLLGVVREIGEQMPARGARAANGEPPAA